MARRRWTRDGEAFVGGSRGLRSSSVLAEAANRGFHPNSFDLT
jgi:hypothetical protein